MVKNGIKTILERIIEGVNISEVARPIINYLSQNPLDKQSLYNHIKEKVEINEEEFDLTLRYLKKHQIISCGESIVYYQEIRKKSSNIRNKKIIPKEKVEIIYPLKLTKVGGGKAKLYYLYKQ